MEYMVFLDSQAKRPIENIGAERDPGEAPTTDYEYSGPWWDMAVDVQRH